MHSSRRRPCSGSCVRHWHSCAAGSVSDQLTGAAEHRAAAPLSCICEQLTHNAACNRGAHTAQATGQQQSGGRVHALTAASVAMVCSFAALQLIDTAVARERSTQTGSSVCVLDCSTTHVGVQLESSKQPHASTAAAGNWLRGAAVLLTPSGPAGRGS